MLDLTVLADLDAAGDRDYRSKFESLVDVGYEYILGIATQ